MVRDDINKMELETAPSFPTFSSEYIALESYDEDESIVKGDDKIKVSLTLPVVLFEVTIHENSIARLAPHTWFDDTLVDFTVNKVLYDLKENLKEASILIHAFPTTVFSMFESDYITPVQGVFDNYKDLTNLDYLIIPLAKSNHFSCIVVENVKSLLLEKFNKEVRIHHMDSLNGGHDRNEAINIVKHFLMSKLTRSKCGDVTNAIEKITSLGSLLTPKQTNTWDCGLYVSEYVKCFLQGAIAGETYDQVDKFMFKFSQSDITHIRTGYNFAFELLLLSHETYILNQSTDNSSAENITFNLETQFSINLDKYLKQKDFDNSNTQNQLLDINNIKIIDNNNNNSNNNSTSSVIQIIESQNYNNEQWNFSAEVNEVNFYCNKVRIYKSFKFPLQCTNAPQKVLMYYRESYEPFKIYAHYEVDALVVKGKLYFSMCVLYNATYGSNYILVAIAFTTCVSPVKRYWVQDREANRFLEWQDKHISSFSCVPSIEFDEPALIIAFRDYLRCSRKLYDKERQIKFTSKNAAKSNANIPRLDKFDGDFDETLAVWTGPRDPDSWQRYLLNAGLCCSIFYYETIYYFIFYETIYLLI